MESIPRSFTPSFHYHQFFCFPAPRQQKQGYTQETKAVAGRKGHHRAEQTRTEPVKVLEELAERSGPGNAGLQEKGGKLGGNWEIVGNFISWDYEISRETEMELEEISM